jgi:hypothetical protein
MKIPMKPSAILLAITLVPVIGSAQSLTCSTQNFKPVSGITSVVDAQGVTLTWPGEHEQQLRARFALRDNQPVVAELAARAKSGPWIILGRDLAPQFEVTTGKRRMANTEMDILKKENAVTPENLERYKWNVFWDAPLAIDGHSHLVGPPRSPDEVARAAVDFKSTNCSVTSDVARVSVAFNGLTLGIFAGDLQFTVYKGSNLLRQEAIASTQADSVAYIYKAGLKGFKIAADTKLVWRDTSQVWQENDFGGEPNQQPVNLRARNRLEVLETGAGSLAVFPPPHKFFFARENEVNLGYVFYRKDSDTSVTLGVMQPEHGEGYAPWGITDEVWKRRSGVAREQTENYALYNAPPGTLQRMAVYYYLSPTGATPRRRPSWPTPTTTSTSPSPASRSSPATSILSSTRWPATTAPPTSRHRGFQSSAASASTSSTSADFHDDSDFHDPGPLRLPEQKALLRRYRPPLRQELPCHARGGGQRLPRRPLVPHDAQAGLLHPSAQTPRRPALRNHRPHLRQGLPSRLRRRRHSRWSTTSKPSSG